MTQDESEWKTRKKRIDPRLDATGWALPRGRSRPSAGPFRTEEEETDNGPADYALWLDHQVVGGVEAKKLTVGTSGWRPSANFLRLSVNQLVKALNTRCALAEAI